MRAKVRQHYQENPRYYAEKGARWKAVHDARNRNWLTAFLLEHPCVDCNEDDVRCLTFDHVRGEKDMNISDMVRNTTALQVLIDEVAKCVVRCANCHMKKTAKDFNWWSHRYMESITASHNE